MDSSGNEVGRRERTARLVRPCGEVREDAHDEDGMVFARYGAVCSVRLRLFLALPHDETHRDIWSPAGHVSWK